MTVDRANDPQFLNVAAVAFDVLRGLTFALTISFPL